MTHTMIEQYCKLTEFLGMVLGEDYEIILSEVVGNASKVITTANEAADTSAYSEACCDLDDDKFHIGEGEETPRYIITENGNQLRCSTFSIKDMEDRTVATLCIKFDNSRFQELSKKVLELCGACLPEPSCSGSSVSKDLLENPDTLRNSLAAVSERIINQVLSESTIPVGRLVMDEKMAIVQKFHDHGVFLFKGAVKQVASRLECSQASIYRYLSKLENDQYPAV